MKIIDKYITRLFLKSLLYAVVVFSFIICITYIFDRIDTIFKLGAPIPLFLLSLFYSFPSWISMTFPVSSLLAVLFVIGDMARNGEITALRTSGFGILRIASPLIFAGIIITFFFMFFDNTVLVNANKKYITTWKYKIKKHTSQPNVGFNVVQIENGKLFSAKIIDGNNEKITGLMLLQLDNEMNIKEKITTTDATMVGDHLELTDCTTASFTDGNLITKKFQHKQIQFTKKPSEFINIRKNPDEMSYIEISDMIWRLDKSGIPSHKEQVYKHSKLSKPFAILIMILLGIPFAIKTAKTAKIFSFAVSIFVGFLYWGAVSLGAAMGVNRTLPPVIAAWIANILFLLVAVVLIYKTEKI